MATLDWPAYLVPAKATWGLQANTEAFTSPLNRAVQTLERPGARWKVTLQFPPMKDADRGRLEAFLASLGGMAGRFRLWPHQRPGSALYSPQVSGSMVDFKQLGSGSWPVSTLVLRAGDYLSAGGELKMVTADVTSDAAGAATIPVAPAFRKAPASGSPIVLNRPSAVMMLTSDDYSVAVMPGRISDAVVINAVEMF